MDLKHFRRHMQFPPHPSARDVAHAGNHDKSLMVSRNCVERHNYTFSHSDSYYHHFGYDKSDLESRMAGMKIFATIMLNAWRKRRDEVKRLLEEVAELKRGVRKNLQFQPVKSEREIPIKDYWT